MIKINKDTSMVFLLGLFSTFQLVEIGGVSIFSLILFIFAVKTILTYQFKIENRQIFLLLLSICFSQVMCLFISVPNASQWRVASYKAFALFIALFFTYSYVKKADRWKVFFHGVYISCIIQVFWCYAQFIIYRLFGAYLNNQIFVRLLKMWNANELQGRVITGLNTNSGLLVPILFFVIIMGRQTIIRLLAYGLCFLSGNSTCVICGLLYVVFLIIFGKKNLLKPSAVSKKKMLGIALSGLIFLLVMLASNELSSRIFNSINDLIGRLSSVRTGESIVGSTYTHLRYYTSIPYLFSNLNILNILFGFGLSCAGLPFVMHYNQYTSKIYVPESDPITYLWGTGIIGGFLFYKILIQSMIQGYNVDKKYFLFFITVLVCGIFYNNQMNWLILAEWLIIEGIRRGEQMDVYCEIKALENSGMG